MPSEADCIAATRALRSSVRACLAACGAVDDPEVTCWIEAARARVGDVPPRAGADRAVCVARELASLCDAVEPLAAALRASMGAWVGAGPRLAVRDLSAALYRARVILEGAAGRRASGVMRIASVPKSSKARAG
jgi:hypothetical protein